MSAAVALVLARQVNAGALCARGAGADGATVLGSGLPGFAGEPPDGAPPVRPGVDGGSLASGAPLGTPLSTPRLAPEPSLVREWVELVCGRLGAQHALIVASDGELAMYDPPLERLLALRMGMPCVSRVASLTAPGALSSVLASFRAASGRRLLVCCPSGQVRTGTLGALWLHRTFDISLELAAREVSQTPGAIRRPSLADLIALLAGPSSGMGTGAGIGSSVSAWGTPRLNSARLSEGQPNNSEQQQELLIITTGGTLDKDYPRSTGGYAFEIGQPAAVNVLGELAQIGALGFAYRILSICRKDSQDVTKEDREAMAAACTINARHPKILITHGTDTMVETAEFLAAALGYADPPATSTGEQTIVIVRDLLRSRHEGEVD
jgi:hypothetical protein